MTTGAAASKKARLSAPVASHSDWARWPSVKGPVATMSASTPTASSSRLLARRREISMRGWAQRRAVTSFENASRSTASAPPAATRLRIAASMRRDPSAERLRFEHSRSAIGIGALKRVRAHELRGVTGFMHGGAHLGAHLDKLHTNAAIGELERRLAACGPAPKMRTTR